MDSSSTAGAAGLSSPSPSDDVSSAMMAKRSKMDQHGINSNSDDSPRQQAHSASASPLRSFSDRENFETLSMLQGLYNTFEYFTLNSRPAVVQRIEFCIVETLKQSVKDGFDCNYEPVMKMPESRKSLFSVDFSTNRITRANSFVKLLNSSSPVDGGHSYNQSNLSSSSLPDYVPDIISLIPTAILPLNALQAACYYGMSTEIIDVILHTGYWDIKQVVRAKTFEYSGLSSIQICFQRGYHANFIALQNEVKRRESINSSSSSSSSRNSSSNGLLLSRTSSASSSSSSSLKGVTDCNSNLGTYVDELTMPPLTRRASNEVFYDGLGGEGALLDVPGAGITIDGTDSADLAGNFIDGYSSSTSPSNTTSSNTIASESVSAFPSRNNSDSDFNRGGAGGSSNSSVFDSYLGVGGESNGSRGKLKENEHSQGVNFRYKNNIVIGVGSHDGYKSPSEDRYDASTISASATSSLSSLSSLSSSKVVGGGGGGFGLQTSFSRNYNNDISRNAFFSDSSNSAPSQSGGGNINSANEIGCYCVFDGHGGYHYAESVSLLLPEMIKTEIVKEIVAHRAFYRKHHTSSTSTSTNASVLSDDEIDLLWISDSKHTPKIIAKILHRQFIAVDRMVLTVAELYENYQSPNDFGGFRSGGGFGLSLPNSNGGGFGLTRNNSGSWGSSSTSSPHLSLNSGSDFSNPSSVSNSASNSPRMSPSEYLQSVVGTLSKRPMAPSMFLRGGSTGAVVVALLGHIIVANVGDSPCLAFNDVGKLLFQTVDHNPDNPLEYERVRNLGAHVEISQDYGDLRVYSSRGQIAVTRAFGQYDFKKKNNSLGGGGFSSRSSSGGASSGLSQDAAESAIGDGSSSSSSSNIGGDFIGPCDIHNYKAHIITAVPQLYIWPRYFSSTSSSSASSSSSSSLYSAASTSTNTSSSVESFYSDANRKSDQNLVGNGISCSGNSSINITLSSSERFDYMTILDCDLQLTTSNSTSSSTSSLQENEISSSNSSSMDSSSISSSSSSLQTIDFLTLFSDSFTEALRDHRLKKRLTSTNEVGNRPDQIIGNFLNNEEALLFINYVLQCSSSEPDVPNGLDRDVVVAARELALRQANKFNLFDQYLGDNTTIILADMRKSYI